MVVPSYRHSATYHYQPASFCTVAYYPDTSFEDPRLLASWVLPGRRRPRRNGELQVRARARRQRLPRGRELQLKSLVRLPYHLDR